MRLGDNPFCVDSRGPEKSGLLLCSLNMKNGPYALVIAPADYPGKKYRDRYCYEHRLVFWRTHGYLPETVHHGDGEKLHNDPDNLDGMTRPAHTRLHSKPVTFAHGICEQCGAEFTKPKRGQKKMRFCSRRCVGKFCVEELNCFGM